MTTRYLAAKLFFGLAIISACLGVVIFRRGLPTEFYFNPLFLLLLPRLMPFSVAILSACFGVIYFAFERNLKRQLSTPLTLVHLICYVLTVFGYSVITRFWWRVLGEEQATNLPMPLWSVLLAMTSIAIGCLAFVANLSSSIWRPSRKA
jgi:hypothetical protein